MLNDSAHRETINIFKQISFINPIIDFVTGELSNPVSYFTDNFDLDKQLISCVIFIENSNFYVRVIYNKLYFDSFRVEQIIKSALNIVMQYGRVDPFLATMDQLEFIDNHMANTILYEWNQTEQSYPEMSTLVDLFNKQVIENKDVLALSFKDIRLTYQELDMISSQIAHYLIDLYKIKVAELVRVCMNRSHNLIVNALSIMKCGAAYVPIDPNYPQDRVEYIVVDTKVRIIICDSENANKFSQYRDKELIIVDTPSFINLIAKRPTVLPEQKPLHNSLAYVIYTSGTTGNPKGVQIEHKSVVNLIMMQGAEFGLYPKTKGNNKNCLWFSNFVFDAHVSEVYTALLNGHSLYIASNEDRYDLHNLSNYIKK